MNELPIYWANKDACLLACPSSLAIVVLYVRSQNKQEAQLSQRGRAMPRVVEYFG